MTQEFTQNEAEVRRFLLGELSETERTAFEENFIADESFFEQIRVVEDELIESYTRGTFAETDKSKFERNFLITEKRRQRVAFTRSMLAKLSENRESTAAKKTETAANYSVWNSIADFFKTPKLAFGAAFALLLATFGGWFLLNDSNKQEIVQQTTPTPTVEIIQPDANQTASPNQNVAVNSNAKTPPKKETNANNSGQKKETPNINPNAQKTPPASVSPVLALFAGTIRSEGKTKTLNLPENAESVSLQLNLESVDYKIYRAEIVNADGKVVAQSGNLRTGKSKINFAVPARKFLKGDYLVKLSALNPNNETESVADYTFRINRK